MGPGERTLHQQRGSQSQTQARHAQSLAAVRLKLETTLLAMVFTEPECSTNISGMKQRSAKWRLGIL